MRNKHRLQLVLVAGALAVGLTSPAHAFAPRPAQNDTDPAALGDPGDDPKPKVEERIIVTTVNAEDGVPVTTEQRRVLNELQRHAGQPAGGGGGGFGGGGSSGGSGGAVVQTWVRDGEKPAGPEAAWLGVSTEEPSDALTSQLALQPGEGLPRREGQLQARHGPLQHLVLQRCGVFDHRRRHLDAAGGLRGQHGFPGHLRSLALPAQGDIPVQAQQAFPVRAGHLRP